MTIDEIPEDLVITMTDVRRHHCVDGTRRWFNQRGLDFRDFVKNGINARTFVERGDGLSTAVVADVMERNRNG